MMHLGNLPSVEVYHNVDAARFRDDIVKKGQPAILKNLVGSWPVVAAAGQSAGDFIAYLRSYQYQGKIEAVRCRAAENGFMFYNKRFTGFNFERRAVTLDGFLSDIQASAENPGYATHSWQSAHIDDFFPEFLQQHPMDLLPDSVRPRIWLGNNTVVGTHNDDSENIACVIAGKRRFTFFPPEQLPNLYIGPLEKTPAGAPVSLVDLRAPDFAKFPRIKAALATATIAEVEPGDAVYVPILWWHHVEALDGINGLVNYWYGGALDDGKALVGLDTLLLSILTYSHMSPAVKQAWKATFDHYVWSDSDTFAHIPDHVKGVLGDVPDAQRKQLAKWLADKLNEYADS